MRKLNSVIRPTDHGWPFCLLLLCGFFCFLAFPASARAGDAAIDEIIVTNSDTDLLLYLTAKNCFTTEMEKAVHNGIPATFTFYVDLLKTRKNWPDHKLESHGFSHTLTYDNLKEQYLIELSEQNNKTITTGSLAQAKTLMAEVNGFKVSPLDDLTPDAVFQLKIKAKLARKTLPLYFHYLIPFFSLWDFETDWYTVEFRY